jgi:nicotinamidase-related amidase
MMDLGVDVMRPAVIAIDCHRGHLDPEVATMPLAADDDPDASRRNVERHNLEGTVGCEIMPALYDPARDWVVDTKKRYDCFVATDLEFLLKSHGINTLLVTGVNTSSCVLATVTAANVRDYVPIVVEDCVDTMDGPEMHEAALACIRAAFGWVMSSEQVVQSLFADLP